MRNALCIDAQFGKATAGVAYTALNYRLGEEFASLHAHGTAEIASVYGSYPLIRSRSTNLYAVIGFDAKTFQDKVDLVSAVTDRVSLYGAIYGQFASKNVDISEKMGLGGMYAVRAYPTGEAYSDEGYVATLEARLLLPKFSERLPGQFHLIGFADTGSGTINQNPWTTGTNHRTLSGAGVGVNWEDYNNFVVNAYWAHKLGNEVATYAPDRNGRFWIQVVKFF